MSYTVVTIFRFSISIALIVGMARYDKINRAYHPFLTIIIAAFIAEICSAVFEWLYKTNAVSSNIYSLIECFLWLWQFKRWNLGFEKKWMWGLLYGMLLTLWISEIIINGITSFTSVFSLVYSFIVTFFAINQINRLIVEEKTNLLKNAKFLICAGIIVFYPYSILVNSFYLFNLEVSDGFLAHIYYILIYINLFVNLLYALAMLWVPTRERFTLPSL